MGKTPGKSGSKPAQESEQRKYPTWLRWLLAKWWSDRPVVLGLLTSILLFPLAQGVDQWWPGMLNQVAAPLVLPSNQLLLAGIGAALADLQAVFSHHAPAFHLMLLT